MKDTYIKNVIKFTIVIFLFLFGDLIELIPISLFNLDINNISPNTQIILSMFRSIFIIIILIILYKNDFIKDFKNLKKDKYNLFEIGFKYWVVGLVFMATFNIIINKISPNEIANNEEAIRAMIKVNPYLMFISTALIAPVAEETIFRKSFKTIIKNNLMYVLISGIVFGSLHVLGSVTNNIDYLYILPYSSLGIAFAYIYYKTDNIYVPITMHMLHNTIMTLMTIFLSGTIL